MRPTKTADGPGGSGFFRQGGLEGGERQNPTGEIRSLHALNLIAWQLLDKEGWIFFNEMRTSLISTPLLQMRFGPKSFAK
jgi:hypothetical protein